jgi:nicotinamide phosphoribosyltransferase
MSFDFLRNRNPIFGASDSYKYSHPPQYPTGMVALEAYLEARSDKRWPFVQPFGIQYNVQRVFGNPITKEHIDYAQHRCALHFGNDQLFNRKPFEKIVNKYGGYWPVEVRGVPEGMKIPVKHALVVVKSLDEELAWGTNFAETKLSHLWYPMTVATLSRHCYEVIQRHLEETGNPELACWKLHDFGFRGASSEESAAIGGAAHLINFRGTDTTVALELLTDYYNIEMAGFSIPASEHSTISSWMRDGRRQLGEEAACRNMLYQYPTGLVASVSDTDDIIYACEKIWGELLHDEVLKRDGTLVIRPDSGNPVEIVMKCLRILDNKFGSRVNNKGYRVLNDKVRIIQGDGVDPVVIDMVYSVMAINGYSADNVGFGMGGALIQKVNRDDLGFAFKADEITIDSATANPVTVDKPGINAYPVHKQPKTDTSKVSKSGPLTLYLTDKGEFKDDKPGLNIGEDLMQDHVYYRTGEFPYTDSFDNIRKRAA